jgi:uncharacterized phiE125 gp8 family phage protein
MRLLVIDAPTVPLASLAEVKAHLRVDHTDDDDKIGALIWAAQNEFAGPDGWVGRSFSLQQLELQLSHFPSCDDILLPCPPLLVDDTHPLTVKYIDAEGAEQTVDPAIYSVVTSGLAGIARVALNYRQVWPAPRWQHDAVRIRYFAGYKPDDIKTAEGLKAAIKLHVGVNYDGEDADKARRAIDALLSTYRVF